MVKKIGISQIKECIDGIDIASYCNQVEYSKSDLSKALSNMNISLSNLVKTKINNVENFDIQHTFKDDTCILSIAFKMWDIEDKISMSLGHDGYDKFLQSLTNIIYLIAEGTRAIRVLNDKINEIQNNKGSSVIIIYKWGIADRFCKVFDWDYDKLKIKLSKTAIMQLIDLVDDSSTKLEEYIQRTDWSVSIKEYIAKFNRIPLHEKINAVIGKTDIDKILTENMLSVDDIVSIIGHSKGKSGIQEIKSVSMVNELGKFVVVAIWKVDYSKKSLSMQIMHNKVMDIENDRFISDRDILDRMEKKINISNELVERMFN